MNRLAFAPLAFTLLATPALAHFGDHTALSLMALAEHVFETDHIVFAAIAVLTGVLAYRAGKRAGRNERGDVS